MINIIGVIYLRSCTHFKRSYWLIYLSEKLYPFQEFWLENIFILKVVPLSIYFGTIPSSDHYPKFWEISPISDELPKRKNLPPKLSVAHVWNAHLGPILSSQYCVLVVLLKLCLGVLDSITSIGSVAKYLLVPVWR